ncbi:MAG: Hsp20/alpha crystallin family protein [Candidatus Falkowbacteria bacterium]|nr:MAG: Hsp20/alpha crystallin family protein [Candidatus Falkowbacteria bacterium]
MLFNTNKSSQLVRKEEPSIDEWLKSEEDEPEGQLAVDVFHDDKRIIIKSTIAGAKPEDLKISLHNDLLMIKGRRDVGEKISEENFLFRECYWGPFSRSIILPAAVDNKRVEAELENGVLTITLYKSDVNKIEVKLKD